MKIIVRETQLTRIIEKVTKEKVICDECGWSWKLSEGGKDPYICHKCGHDNSEK
jgi:tRNA(Ile2) C34 agmatinyltransferase TiaS